MNGRHRVNPSLPPAVEGEGAIGVLALQGAFVEHLAVLARLGVPTREVRLPEHLDGLAGLIIPGGESTVIGKLMVKYGLDDAIRSFAGRGGAIWGTCAGMILLAREVGRDQPLLGLLDIDVERNAYGSQLASFEEDIALTRFGITDLRAVFIRAPVVSRVGPSVTTEATDGRGNIVAVSDGRLLGTSFHPELTDDGRLHGWFAALARDRLVIAH
ncbi:MAG TPA: pyridoxal 5'-phosphate synthase glutaminase subunit PdxT [Thermomicrobiales bacterium]|jgi:5'-phosphate synthase pdxT subunit|nr:pyridoxal 5'-phosphate synthase glutaminase subunit PdxT [Thermomicrobiales bacterium]